MSEVILVDSNDMPVGSMEKMEAHKKGLLHRAFSVIIFNTAGEMLLQQRAMSKYHSGGLWTNACCSHPMPGEEITNAASRRLEEELGFVTPIGKIFDFTYRTEFDNGLIENEFDHVFAGTYDGPVYFNTDEVMNIKYMSMAELTKQIQAKPEDFTSWFVLAFPKIESWYQKKYPK